MDEQNNQNLELKIEQHETEQPPQEERNEVNVQTTTKKTFPQIAIGAIAFAVVAVIVVLIILLGGKGQNTNEPSEPKKPKEEIELERALQLAEEGAWGGAYLLLDDLMERGYYLDYKDKRDAIYEDYLIAEAIYKALSFKNLKDKLKNPDSLVIYNVYITAEKSEYGDYYIFAITYDYGASNSFGGMVRDTIDSSYSTKEAQQYVGKTINYSHVDLTDIAKLSSDEWHDKLYGDFRLYHHNLRNDEEGNIWE